MEHLKKVDMYFTQGGDLAIDASGGIEQTEYGYRSLAQTIRNRIMSSKGDWLLTSDLGMNTEQFMGEAATDALIGEIVSAMEQELVRDRLLIPGEFSILTINLGNGIVMFRIVIPTTDNDDTVTLVFDSNEKFFRGV